MAAEAGIGRDALSMPRDAIVTRD